MPSGSPKGAKSRGPHGLGDPDDTSLRKVELEVLIPKKMREIAHKEQCSQQVADFSSCCKEAGLAMVVKCRVQNTALWGCLQKWYFDEEFKQRCTTEYLAERTEYRRTGIKRNVRNVRADIRESQNTPEAADVTT